MSHGPIEIRLGGEAVGALERLDLEPGDLLCVCGTSGRRWRPDQIHHTLRELDKMVPDGVKVAYLEDARLVRVRAVEAEHLPTRVVDPG